MDKESKGDYTANNPSSTAYGKYQLIDSTNNEVAKALGTTPEYLRTPKGQEQAMNYLYDKYTDVLDNLHEPVNKENVYTIHQLGIARATRYFNNELTGKDYTIMWKNLPKNIQSTIKRTDHEEILKEWNKLYRGETS